MKIAYVYDAVYPWETGGIQKRVWELSSRLAINHEVHWYGLQYWEGDPVIHRSEVTLHGVNKASTLYVNGRRSISEAISFSAALLPALLKERFDIIDCQQFPYFPLFSSKVHSVVRNSTLIFTWHEVWGDYWYDYLGLRGFFGKTIEEIISTLPDKHIAVSKRTKRDAIELGVADPYYLPNGVDVAMIDTVAESPMDVDVLFAGRLIKEKGGGLLVQAINELRKEEPDIRCLIVGEGPEQARIHSLIEEFELSNNITIVDFVESYQEILGLMKAADVFALLSQREGFGISALEALACGTPVVTIAHPQNAVQELIEDGQTGRICQPVPSAVATAIQEARDKTSQEICRSAAKQYEWDQIARETENYYKNVI